MDAEHKGRGYSKGHYVLIDEAELKAVEIESTHEALRDSLPRRDSLSPHAQICEGPARKAA